MSALVGTAATPLESVTGLGEGLIEKLSAAGVTTVESLADMTPEQLEAIEGIGPKTVEKISLAVNNYFASLESGEAGGCSVEGEEIAGGSVAEEVGRRVKTLEVSGRISAGGRRRDSGGCGCGGVGAEVKTRTGREARIGRIPRGAVLRGCRKTRGKAINETLSRHARWVRRARG